MSDLVTDLFHEDPRGDMVRWANRSEYRLKNYGDGLDPPVGFLDYPDLFERGWGWDRILTTESSGDDMATYKKYLKDYYSHNTAESVAQAWQNERDAYTASNGTSNGTGVGTGLLATLAILCIEAEKKFISKRRVYKIDVTTNEIDLSKKIQEGVCRIICLEGEFPVAAAALMFIAKEAELMCKWLDIGTYHPRHSWSIAINIARRCALDFMTYKGPESFCVAGLMMGIAKETKTICEAIEQDPCGSRKASSTAILLNGWEVLEILHGEFFSARQDGTIAEINTIGELTSKENDGKHSLKTSLKRPRTAAQRKAATGIKSMD